MKKVALFLAALFFVQILASDTQAQVLNGVYVSHLSSERKPVPYQYLREADVMWSKVVWRKIILTEKENLPLYFPRYDMEDRKSLVQLIMWGIKNKSLTAFSTDEFASQLTLAEIDQRFGSQVDTLLIPDDETGELIPIINKKKASMDEVTDLLVKEMWFFDKQRSVMEVRIVGICPIRTYYSETDLERTDPRQSQLFWIYYPEARNIFANQPVYNPNNQGQQLTFDDIFFKRIFSSYIYQESNVYDNRTIDQYTTGLEVLLESERIKEKIFEFEHDLWEF